MRGTSYTIFKVETAGLGRSQRVWQIIGAGAPRLTNIPGLARGGNQLKIYFKAKLLMGQGPPANLYNGPLPPAPISRLSPLGPGRSPSYPSQELKLNIKLLMG
jgi:hypothetical protein